MIDNTEENKDNKDQNNNFDLEKSTFFEYSDYVEVDTVDAFQG